MSNPNETIDSPQKAFADADLFALVLAKLDHLTLEVAKLTQHTVPCTTIDGKGDYKCAYNPKYPWPGHLCPDHAKRIGKHHRDLHLANAGPQAAANGQPE
jgi:hypothetical protein